MGKEYVEQIEALLRSPTDARLCDFRFEVAGVPFTMGGSSAGKALTRSTADDTWFSDGGSLSLQTNSVAVVQTVSATTYAESIRPWSRFRLFGRFKVAELAANWDTLNFLISCYDGTQTVAAVLQFNSALGVTKTVRVMNTGGGYVTLAAFNGVFPSSLTNWTEFQMDVRMVPSGPAYERIQISNVEVLAAAISAVPNVAASASPPGVRVIASFGSAADATNRFAYIDRIYAEVL